MCHVEKKIISLNDHINEHITVVQSLFCDFTIQEDLSQVEGSCRKQVCNTSVAGGRHASVTLCHGMDFAMPSSPATAPTCFRFSVHTELYEQFISHT